MNKVLIRERFAKNLKNYDENARIQKIMAERLFSFVQTKSPERILEIGCGTGFLTKLCAKNLEYKEFVALDIVDECRSYVKFVDPKIKFLSTDIEEYLMNSDERFDLIVSNASLQWVEDFERVINSLKNRLNSNGELVFSTFGNENFREIYHVIGTTLKYYSIQELQNMFPDSKIEPEIRIMAFETPKDVLRHLQLTGVNAIESTIWTKKDLIKFENGYKNLCSRRPTLTYNPIYIRIA